MFMSQQLYQSVTEAFLLAPDTEKLNNKADRTKALSWAVTHMLQNLTEIGVCPDSMCVNSTEGSERVLAAGPPTPSWMRISSTADTSTLKGDDSQRSLHQTLGNIARDLRSALPQRQMGLAAFVERLLRECSRAQGSFRCSPETFVCALVLLERLQHANIVSNQDQRMESLKRQRAADPTAPPIRPVITNSSSPAGDGYSTQRVKEYFDTATLPSPGNQLNQEMLLQLSPSMSTAGASRSETSSVRTDVCEDCRDAATFTLHAHNVHLFLGAAVVLAIKTREDCVDRALLKHVADALSCEPLAALTWAERCMCDALQFDLNVSVKEYKKMLHQLTTEHRQQQPGGGGEFLSLFSSC